MSFTELFSEFLHMFGIYETSLETVISKTYKELKFCNVPLIVNEKVVYWVFVDINPIPEAPLRKSFKLSIYVISPYENVILILGDSVWKWRYLKNIFE